jgi:hypothetical protein
MATFIHVRVLLALSTMVLPEQSRSLPTVHTISIVVSQWLFSFTQELI